MSTIKVVKAVDQREAFEFSIKQAVFLVVDDFDSMRKVTINQLRQLGASRIFEAGNGVEALRVLARQPISIVISDWNMPVMDGYEATREIRKRDVEGRQLLALEQQARARRLQHQRRCSRAKPLNTLPQTMNLYVQHDVYR